MHAGSLQSQLFLDFARCFLVAVLGLLCPAIQAQQYLPSTPSAVLELTKVLGGATRSAAEKSITDESPVIVFIPGILGSKLRWPGYVFGENKVDGKRLVYDALQKPQAEVLDSFRIESLDGSWLKSFSRLDVYGTSLDQLREINGGKFPMEFAYDWRADIDDSARELQKWLTNPALKGKNVAFVAHSMGGLVLWRWFQIIPKQQRPIKTTIAMFVGSPIQGSCEAARMLIEGYQAPRNSRVLGKV